ncbi:MAG: terminase small subunit [Lactobacillus helveticus]|uniref:terminase small subunit n=1 Tax=Lactobacillus helveticus TaxID=1587 RepID=UPI0003586A68|nr:terminase small subunit [Lactobacillus helveticus]AGQ23700.1 phage terminase small subunit [Lactobacillus helveticus CNRZ32]KXN77111.1 terminase [Lactobacillus helveticus]MBW7999081.1 terminase small subunit [Lactobacillus helveticus]MBW8063000.1 terminase small subunit [Lactobacillus helveticus]MCT3406200.1 terminase small subunit [Lactobacillus helveticus]
MKLTAKQRKFCDEYIKSGNATEAYFKAGYQIKSNEAARANASRMLTKANIKEYIETRLKQLESKKLAGAREVLEYLTSVMRGEQTESVATAKGIYDNVPVSAKDRISAAKELLKRYPTTDPMEKQKLKKLTADARISEARAKAMENSGQDVELLVEKMLDSLAKEDLKHGS